tara:strand:- start:186 stop:887 length:702 start_codon:yes stop_codon:yes gene_type:complete
MKLTKRKGFNFFRSYFDVYNELETKEDKVAFIDALLERQFMGGKPTHLKGMSKFAYISQTNSIDSQVKGYNDKMRKLGKPLIGDDDTPTYGGKVTPTLQVEEEEEVKVKVEYLPEKTEKVFPMEILNCFDNCLKFFPEHLHPKNQKTWIDTIEKLNRIDKIPFSEIERIVKATREDTFWSQNFLSMTKLRKKKDEVYYIVIFGEKFKPKEKLINRQSQAVIEKNLTGWGKTKI